jgi:carbon-monoxide dehydrogenase medium subunit
MYPAAFEYIVPKDVREAVELLNRYGEDAKLLAGGQSLVPMMKLRLARPKYLLDLNRIPNLSYIREENGCIHCGPMTRHVQFEDSALIREKVPLMSEAVSYIGDAQVRNRGTLGGALVEADPAGDWGPVALALNARMKCIGPNRERFIEAKDFFTFAYTTSLQTNEVLSEVIFPIPGEDSSGVYLKLERIAGDFAIVSVALQMTLDKNSVCRSMGIGLGGAGATPLKPLAAENFLREKTISSDLIEEAGSLILEEAAPLADLRGSAEYKKEVLKVSFKRALGIATQRSREKRRGITS